MIEFTIKIDRVLGGCNFEDSVKEANRLVKLLGCAIEYNFNGVTVWICHSESDLKDVVKQYEEALISGVWVRA